MEALGHLLLTESGGWTGQALRCLVLLVVVPLALRDADAGESPLARYYGSRLSLGGFLFNLIAFPALALALMLVGFAVLLPEFGAQLAGNAAARPWILRQLALEGLLPGLVVNFLAVSLAVSLRPRLGAPATLAVELAVRLAAFAALLALAARGGATGRVLRAAQRAPGLRGRPARAAAALVGAALALASATAFALGPGG